MMLKAGVPLNTALSLVADAVDNAWMAGRIRDMRAGIERARACCAPPAAAACSPRW